MVRARISLLLLFTLLGCSGAGSLGEPSAELFGVRKSYTNVDTCSQEGIGREGSARCYDRLDLVVTVVNAGEVALTASLDRFTLTSAGGKVFKPLPHMGRCQAELRPGQTLRCTLPFTLEPALPAAELFPARLSFPHAPAVEISP
ncbi:hypothetical protein BH24DEI1_BH24DEI1_03500 [soil metagenome]